MEGYNSVVLKKRSDLTDFARQNRKEPTKAERLLWNALSGKRLDGLRFRRQQQIENFIVDFCCMRSRVVIEIDGWSHTGSGSADEARDNWLTEHDFQVLRYTNMEVIHDVQGVADSIAAICKERGELLFGEDFHRRRATGGKALPGGITADPPEVGG